MTLWEEIWQYLQDNYFSAEVGDQYAYLHFDNHTGTTLFAIVLGLCVGMLLACYLLAFERGRVGRFIRRLIARGAHAPDTALTLGDLGLAKDAAVKASLSHASVARKLVNVVSGDRIYIGDRYVDEMTDELHDRELARTEEGKKKAEKAARAAAAEERRERLTAAFGEAPAPETSEDATETTEKSIADGEPMGENSPIAEEAAPAPATAEGETLAPEEAAPAPEPGEEAGENSPTRDPKQHRLPKLNFETDRFYIPEENKFRAENRFAKERHTPLLLAGATVLFFALVFGLIRLIPLVIGFFDSSLVSLFG